MNSGTPSWDDFDIVELDSNQPSFFIPDNGMELVILWAIGPEYGFRVTRKHPGYVTHTHIDPRLGQRISERIEATEEDQAAVDEVVNEYLDEGGIPPRPRGFDWYSRTPRTLIDTTDPGSVLFGAVSELHTKPMGDATLLAAREVVSRYFPGR